MSRSKGQLGDICLEAQRRKHRVLYDNFIKLLTGSRSQMPRKPDSRHLLASESENSKVLDGEGSDLRTCKSDFIRLPAGGSDCSCATSTDGPEDKKHACNPTETIASQTITKQLAAPSEDETEDNMNSSVATIVQTQPILQYFAACPCGCALSEDANDKPQPDNVFSNISPPIARQDAIIQTQPTPNKFAEFPCGCTSSIEGRILKAFLAPPNVQIDEAIQCDEVMADQNSQSKSNTDFESENVESVKNSPKDSSTPTDMGKPNASVNQTETVAPRESETPKDVAVKPMQKETLEENDHRKTQKSPRKRFWKRPTIVVRSSIELATNQNKQEGKDQAEKMIMSRDSLEIFHKATQYEDPSSLLQQENNDLQISIDDNDQTGQLGPSRKFHKETQYEDSSESIRKIEQNVEKCAKCARVPELLQKIFDMEQKMNQQECSLRQLKCSVRSLKGQERKPNDCENSHTSNTDQSTQWEYEINESARPSSSGEKSTIQSSGKKSIPTEPRQNLNDEACESLIEQFMHIFIKPKCKEILVPPSCNKDCPCSLQEMHKRSAEDTPATSTMPQEGSKVEARASSTQSEDSQGAEGLMDDTQSIESTQTLGQHSLESRGSSLCQFCRDRDLPVLDHVVTEVFDLIGGRPLDRIVMTVLLREDNLYHVNIRELGTGFVVGCLLANDAAIEEAISLCLFEQILTFCVTDVRSTIKPKDGPFAIHFELMEKRENGGGFDKETAETEKVQKFATQVLGLNIGYVSLLFSLTNAIKMDKQTSDCNLRLPFGFPAHVNRDPGELFSSRLILIDNLESYSTRSCTDSQGRDNIGSSSSLFLRIVTGRADREEH